MTANVTAATKLAALAVLAVAGAGAAHADKAAQGRELFTLEYRYDAARSPEANYNAFRNLAERKCETQGVRPINTIVLERACVLKVMDRFVDTLGRAEVAAIHAARTGRTPAAIPARDFASRG